MYCRSLLQSGMLLYLPSLVSPELGKFWILYQFHWRLGREASVCKLLPLYNQQPKYLLESYSWWISEGLQEPYTWKRGKEKNKWQPSTQFKSSHIQNHSAFCSFQLTANMTLKVPVLLFFLEKIIKKKNYVSPLSSLMSSWHAAFLHIPPVSSDPLQFLLWCYLQTALHHLKLFELCSA